MPYVEAIALLRTRSEVREALAKEIESVLAACSTPGLSLALGDLPTGSDREVVQTSMRLDKCFRARGAADALAGDAALGHRVCNIFAQALLRMKELPPDPRQVLHPLPKPAASARAHGPRRRR
jgi:hypothetical protein